MEKRDLEEHPFIHGWLSKTAKNITKRHIRKKNSEATVSFDDVHERELADFMTPAKIVEDMTLQQDFIDLLKERLTPEEFLIYEMKYVKKLSNAEIAAKMRIDVNAVNVRLSRLKNKMTKIFNEM
jgi:RNA polymerase sigma factor (sigma-70 family)